MKRIKAYFELNPQELSHFLWSFYAYRDAHPFQDGTMPLLLKGLYKVDIYPSRTMSSFNEAGIVPRKHWSSLKSYLGDIRKAKIFSMRSEFWNNGELIVLKENNTSKIFLEKKPGDKKSWKLTALLDQNSLFRAILCENGLRNPIDPNCVFKECVDSIAIRSLVRSYYSNFTDRALSYICESEYPLLSNQNPAILAFERKMESSDEIDKEMQTYLQPMPDTHYGAVQA